jgi:hypothetical protein
MLLTAAQSTGENTVYIDSITGTSSTRIVGRIPTTPLNAQTLKTSLTSLLQSSTTYVSSFLLSIYYNPGTNNSTNNTTNNSTNNSTNNTNSTNNRTGVVMCYFNFIQCPSNYYLNISLNTPFSPSALNAYLPVI